MINALLEEHPLPPFSAIRPEHIEPAIDTLLHSFREGVNRLLQNSNLQWDDLQPPIDAWNNALNQAWGLVSHMNAVVNSEEYRQAHNRCLAKLSEFSSWLGQNRELFLAYQRLSESDDFNGLDEAQRKVVSHSIRDFRLAGVDLAEDDQARFTTLSVRLSELTSSFSDRVLDATMAWSQWIDNEDDLSGLPETALANARQLAQSKGHATGWLLNLEPSCYMSVMSYCDNRDLRQSLYTAYVTRASEQGPHGGQFDNSATLRDIMAVRFEMARLLGFDSYADYALATRMASSVEEVNTFLQDLVERCKPIAEQELAGLKAFARETYGAERLQAWDIPYYSEKLRQADVDLAEEDQARFTTLSVRLSELTSSFSDRVLDATMAWSQWIDNEDDLSGLPETALANARQLAQSKGHATGWLLNLEPSCYMSVMSYCDNRDLRQSLYTAYVTRASEQGPHGGQFDNSATLRDIMAVRFEMARLLGFDSYADYALATRMASSVEEVNTFLQDLVERCKPIAEQELAGLKAFARETYGAEQLQAWDIPYYSEKLRQARYDINQEALRPWFPIQRVMQGLFAVAERLYGLSFRAHEDVDVWHEEVALFDIYRDNTLVGRFYVDLHAREHKRDGAWMAECRTRYKKAQGDIQTPVAFITCNFARATGDKPALLTHDDVVTLFHEFGHGLHHLLTRVEQMELSGINGVPWDAVELPSQFMENWCWQKEALTLVSGHYESGEPLPEAMLSKLLAAKNFQSAMMMVRQLEFSLFDFRLHQQWNDTTDIQQLLDAVRKEVAVVTPPPFNRFQHSFAHIFAGGYAAGYYSYLWAEVLSADAFSRFEEDGIFNRETGLEFLHEILERGGVGEPTDMFVAFRGRKPNSDALLRHKGIV